MKRVNSERYFLKVSNKSSSLVDQFQKLTKQSRKERILKQPVATQQNELLTGSYDANYYTNLPTQIMPVSFDNFRVQV